ncbi:prephenate dehydrogenase [Novisyntrophococcus fermenticellae]|uniref:prephenate dehydrogenase n=1 Tax=Novisyntrophococcus fermenticellae TaxID=2068655 RepID=UPI001E56AC89|nr:prephenate dehydrogenase [Novisyntrophococcus fermenticellae]
MGTKIGFIGLGLIGGSIAKAIRKFHPDYQLMAYTHTKATLDQAASDGVIQICCDQIDERFGICDYIFLCAPVGANISYLKTLRDIISPSCILTDVGSVKGDIHQAVQALGMSASFIGGHPMAGSEKTGFENSADYLIENAYYIITPSEEIDSQKVDAYEELVYSLGAIPLRLTAEEHDFITAGVSHLPHIVASALVNEIARLDGSKGYMKMIAAGGFKDITRIASSSPVMWQHICLSNRDMILKVIDSFQEMLTDARKLVDSSDEGGLYAMFEASRDYRDSLPDTVLGPLKKDYVLYCDIYDEAGGIATITTLLAMNSISIKNIGIIHNREFEEGVLRIEFYQEESYRRAALVLTDRNYRIHVRE